MVGSIKNISGQRLEVSRGVAESKAQSEKLSGSVPSTISGSKVDAVLTSKSREALKVMAENPSINMEAVERIKQKIKDILCLIYLCINKSKHHLGNKKPCKYRALSNN